MKVSAREARHFFAFWAPGFAENLENLRKMKVSGTRSAPGFVGTGRPSEDSARRRAGRLAGARIPPPPLNIKRIGDRIAGAGAGRMRARSGPARCSDKNPRGFYQELP